MRGDHGAIHLPAVYLDGSDVSTRLPHHWHDGIDGDHRHDGDALCVILESKVPSVSLDFIRSLLCIAHTHDEPGRLRTCLLRARKIRKTQVRPRQN